ncbi:MAG: cation-translocating P-type ATPase [Erysipelotrichaceae bacterium]|nr:cation-translocating P-type ATPase [Erysipelotrichaceae bacterium]
MEKEQVIAKYGVDINNGLNDNQVNELRKTYGLNKLKEKKKKKKIVMFFAQFKDVMIIILIVAAIISFILAFIEKKPKEFFEPILIIAIVIINAFMGMMQENKAEKALEALNKLSSLQAKVLRNKKEIKIDASNLLPGDVIFLEAGDSVPADCVLLSSVSLKSEEAALTGESLPVDKSADAKVLDDAPIGDQSNKVFSGCSITYGSGKAIVYATGMNTQMGKIANLLNNEEKSKTPLQKKLAQLGKILGIIALVSCAIIFVIGLIFSLPPLEIFMIAVSLAVSAIPEGLLVIVTIALSIGVQKMANKNALVRTLVAVETLGSASIICSDKTGTLTQNKMTLVKSYVDDEASIEDICNKNSDKVKKLLCYATLCCNGVVNVDNNQITSIGDPTETAIIYAAYINGYQQKSLNEKYPRIKEIPFDSNRKLMTSINVIEGKNVVIVKGAFDMLSLKCIKGNMLLAKKYNDEMSEKALRVIAIAYKEVGNINALSEEEIEKDLIFMGLLGMIDPPRIEVKESVKTCKKANIKPIMITGDHIITAKAIAKEIGIFNDGDIAITGKELDSLSEEQLSDQIEKITVYARVSPENKIKIVKAWQKKNHVVAMTGDGVNDAPALKAADIGCAMGINGTDVSKQASDMILTDDNFATIVDAIKYGRGIYSNIKKVISFLLSTNIGEVLIVFFAMLIWHTSPLLSMQLLWVNLVTDSFPSIALGMEEIKEDIMLQKPRNKNESVFANKLGIKIFFQGCMIAILTLIGFKIGEIYGGSLQDGQTLAFMVLSLSQIVHSYNMRSEKSLFEIGIFTNKKLNIAALVSLVMMIVVLFTPLRIVFNLKILKLYLYLIGLALIIAPLFIMEIAKLIIKKTKKH